MAALNIPKVLRIGRLASIINQNTNSRLTTVTNFSSNNIRLFSSEIKEKPANEQSTTSGGGGGVGADADKHINADIELLNNQIKSLTEKSEDLLDKYKRSLAESENLRKRLTKQIDDAKIFGIQKFCKDLLEVADILGHATNAVPNEELNAKNPHLKSLYEGLTMTQGTLQKVFKNHGLEIINPINERFNPNLHEALFQIEKKDVEPNTILEVSKIGYKLHERCVRPALVGVSRH